MVEYKQMLPSILEIGLNKIIESVLTKLQCDGYEFISFSSCCSGGPLLDLKGNLIGINTAIFTQTGILLLSSFIVVFYFSYFL